MSSLRVLWSGVMKRFMDLLLVVVGGALLLPVAIVVAVAVKITSPGPALYWSDRIGRDEQIFRMPKFRTMKLGTPAVASHLMRDPRAALTPIGGFLRRTSLDEVPQLWSVLTGNMSVVGPRPALFNQDDLINLRRAAGVNALRPGITGWAQINGRDELPIPVKVGLDREYLERRTLLFDMMVLLRTVGKLLGDKTVTH